MPLLSSSSQLFPVRLTFQMLAASALAFTESLGVVPSNDLAAKDPVKAAAVFTGIEDETSGYESVTLSIGWPGLMESKIGVVSLPLGALGTESEEAGWDRENLQIGIIPEPRLLALVVAIAAGSLFMVVRRRRRWVA